MSTEIKTQAIKEYYSEPSEEWLRWEYSIAKLKPGTEAYRLCRHYISILGFKPYAILQRYFRTSNRYGEDNIPDDYSNKEFSHEWEYLTLAGSVKRARQALLDELESHPRPAIIIYRNEELKLWMYKKRIRVSTEDYERKKKEEIEQAKQREEQREIERKRELSLQSEAAFKRLMKSKIESRRKLADEYNKTVRAIQNKSSKKWLEDQELLDSYLAVMESTDVTSKAKAIEKFLYVASRYV